MHEPICLCSLPWSLSLYLPSLHSSSPVSCVHWCLQMRLQWWICGRSMSAGLTSWCISTGLNPLSITLVRAFFSFSLPLSITFFPFSQSLTFIDEISPSFLDQLWGIHQHTDPGPLLATKQQTLSSKFPIDIPWGKFWNSLTYWSNGGEGRTGWATSVMQTLCQ